MGYNTRRNSFNMNAAACVCVVLTLCSVSGAADVLNTAKQNGCSKVVELVDKAGLKSALNKASGITFFAPSDAAVAAIPPDVLDVLSKNATLLQDVLKYHVLATQKMAADIKNDELLKTLSGDLTLRTNVYKNGQVVTAEGSVVSKPDLKATNGVVHVIDKVIFPLPTMSIPIFLTFDKDLNNLGFLAYQAKLIEGLQAQNLTVFAPSNEAIEKLPGQVYNDLLMNKTELTDVLTYHVVKGTVYSAGLMASQKVPTLGGKELDIQVTSDGVMVDNAKVIMADVSTTNGVIHVLDKILFPPKDTKNTYKGLDLLVG